jgi:hypothetical protein
MGEVRERPKEPFIHMNEGKEKSVVKCSMLKIPSNKARIKKYSLLI